MNQQARGRGIYQPVSIGDISLGRSLAPTKTHHRPQSSTKDTAINTQRQKLALSDIISIPCLMAVFIFLILLALGYFDGGIRKITSLKNAFIPQMTNTVVQKAAIAPIHPMSGIQKILFSEHVIVGRESLARIAFKYGIAPSTLISVNGIAGSDDLQSGKKLIVPYRDGVRYQAKDDEDARSIASQFGMQKDNILLLPDGSFFLSGLSSKIDMVGLSDNLFHYPVNGRILVAFGQEIDDITDIPYDSDGIDFAAESGSLVLAARDGKVIRTGMHSSYGLYVIMEHSGGWRSFYGYLEKIDVITGMHLNQGDRLGLVGQSGSARSPRVHFILIKNGQMVDPMDYLL